MGTVMPNHWPGWNRLPGRSATTRGVGTRGAARPNVTEGDPRTGPATRAEMRKSPCEPTSPDNSGVPPKPQGEEPGGTRIPYRHRREETGQGPTGLGPEARVRGGTGGVTATELPLSENQEDDAGRGEGRAKGSETPQKWRIYSRFSGDAQAQELAGPEPRIHGAPRGGRRCVRDRGRII